MDEGRFDPGSIFHEVLHPNLHVLCRDTLAKHLRLKLQSFLQGHLRTLEDRPLEQGVYLSAQVSDIHLRKL